jgi:hypothetical protein
MERGSVTDFTSKSIPNFANISFRLSVPSGRYFQLDLSLDPAIVSSSSSAATPSVSLRLRRILPSQHGSKRNLRQWSRYHTIGPFRTCSVTDKVHLHHHHHPEVLITPPPLSGRGRCDSSKPDTPASRLYVCFFFIFAFVLVFLRR